MEFTINIPTDTIAESIDYETLGAEVDCSRVADSIDYDTVGDYVADRIDLSDLAEAVYPLLKNDPDATDDRIEALEERVCRLEVMLAIAQSDPTPQPEPTPELAECYATPIGADEVIDLSEFDEVDPYADWVTVKMHPELWEWFGRNHNFDWHRVD